MYYGEFSSDFCDIWARYLTLEAKIYGSAETCASVGRGLIESFFSLLVEKRSSHNTRM